MKLKRQAYEQEMHTCGELDGVATFQIEAIEVAGKDGDERYVVIDVSQWAFDNDAEVDEFAAKIKAMLSPAVKAGA